MHQRPETRSCVGVNASGIALSQMGNKTLMWAPKLYSLPQIHGKSQENPTWKPMLYWVFHGPLVLNFEFDCSSPLLILAFGVSKQNSYTNPPPTQKKYIHTHDPFYGLRGKLPVSFRWKKNTSQCEPATVSASMVGCQNHEVHRLKIQITKWG